MVAERNATHEGGAAKRIDRTAARRQAEYRSRKALTTATADVLVEALIHACDRSGCSRFVDNLPEERQARMDELVRRLGEARIVVCGEGRKGKR